MNEPGTFAAETDSPHRGPGAPPSELDGLHLRDVEACLAAAIEIAALGVYEFEPGGFLQLSRRACEILGARADEPRISLETWLERVHPEDRDRVAPLTLPSSGRTPEHVSIQYRYRHPDHGLLRLRQVSNVVLRDAAGRPIRATGVVKDITERVANQTHLQQSLELNRDLLASLVDFIAILRRDGVVIALNDAWKHAAASRDLVPLFPGIRVGSRYPDACRSVDAPELAEGIESVLEERSHLVRMEHSIQGTRERRWYVMDVMPLRRGAGGAVVVHRDVTARRRAEEELQRLRTDIWHAHRVAQLGALGASLAHELNQPLAAILSNAQAGLRLLDRTDVDLGEIRAILADVAEDDKRAAAVIAGLRAMLRRKETVRESLDLAKTVRDLLSLLRGEFSTHQIEVHANLAPDCTLSADRAQIQQVVLNLVTNGIEAMQGAPAEARRLEISLVPESERTAVLSVRDHGPGIPETEQSLVFDAFWSTKPQGMGIGLPICRSIVESHGGNLWFENHPERGVTFFMSLPISSAARRSDRDDATAP